MNNTPTHYHPTTKMLYWFDGGHWYFRVNYYMYGTSNSAKRSGMKSGFVPLNEAGLTINMECI